MSDTDPAFVAGQHCPLSGVKVFISSVFYEPYGQRWRLRDQLYECLLHAGHEPWLLEKEGDKLRRKLRIGIKAAILHGIQKSDIVVAIYRTRVGSVMRSEPFHGPGFEVANAVHLGKPVRLYVIGESHDRKLKSTLSLWMDKIILPGGATQVDSETKAIDSVLWDLRDFSYLRGEAGVVRANDNVAIDCERLYAKIAALTETEDYGRAIRSANTVGAFRDPRVNPDKYGDKHAYARLLGVCANVWANRACFDKAVNGAKGSVRLFMELGDWKEMYAQIQAASGILNMAGHDSAGWWNTFGREQALRVFPALVPAFNDSRGSIMTRKGDLSSAKAFLRDAYEATGSPYNLSKYAAVTAALGGHRDVDKALQWVEGAWLTARQSGISVGYVARHAAALAMRVGELKDARRYLDEGMTYCREKGLIHTRLILRREERKLGLLIKEKKM